MVSILAVQADSSTHGCELRLLVDLFNPSTRGDRDKSLGQSGLYKELQATQVFSKRLSQ